MEGEALFGRLSLRTRTAQAGRVKQSPQSKAMQACRGSLLPDESGLAMTGWACQFPVPSSQSPVLPMLGIAARSSGLRPVPNISVFICVYLWPFHCDVCLRPSHTIDLICAAAAVSLMREMTLPQSAGFKSPLEGDLGGLNGEIVIRIFVNRTDAVFELITSNAGRQAELMRRYSQCSVGISDQFQIFLCLSVAIPLRRSLSLLSLRNPDLDRSAKSCKFTRNKSEGSHGADLGHRQCLQQI